MVNRRLWYQVRSCGICNEWSGIGAIFLPELLFLSIWPNAPLSVIILPSVKYRSILTALLNNQLRNGRVIIFSSVVKKFSSLSVPLHVKSCILSWYQSCLFSGAFRTFPFTRTISFPSITCVSTLQSLGSILRYRSIPLRCPTRQLLSHFWLYYK